jgi:hypothetical protein
MLETGTLLSPEATEGASPAATTPSPPVYISSPATCADTLPALFMRVRDETAETHCETDKRSREGGKHT